MTGLDDLASDIRHLFHLVDTLCDQQFGAQDHAARERCDALLWVARDQAEKCKARAAAFLEGEDAQ